MPTPAAWPNAWRSTRSTCSRSWTTRTCRSRTTWPSGKIRPAVVLRKNSQSNRSDRGAATQAVLMSVYRTLKLRGLNPTKTIADALKTYLTTGQLPPMPDENTADG